MSETQWTPGPWAVKWETNVFGGERLVAGTGGHTSNISDVEPENRANANLIAAAPELYAALERAKQCVATHDHAFEESVTEFEALLKCWLEDANAALARARGEVTP